MAPFDPSTPMGRRIRDHAWESTPLGPSLEWPAALRWAVQAMLASREPRSISWGPSLCLLYNDAYAEMMDGRHPGALGRPLPDVWSELWDTIRPDVEAALAGDATFRNSMPLSRFDDGALVQRWHTVAYSPAFDDDGAIAGVQCLTLNVTDRISAQLLHEHELASLRRLFAAAPGFVAVVRGADYTFELVNHAYEMLVGQTGLVGRSARDALPELDAQGYFELLDRVRRTGEPFSGRAMPVSVSTGDSQAERFIDFVFQPIVDEASGNVERIFVQGADVTEREDALRALHDESKGKDQFLAILAHELRNPLAPITTAAALLSAGCDVVRSRQIGEILQRQSTQMRRIVDDLLDVSRVSRGTFHLDHDIVELDTVVAMAIEEVMPLVDAKRHQLDVKVEHGARVTGDAARLTQAVTNLLTNACRYTPAQGELAIALSVEGESARITVRDNGIGIDAAAMPRLFDLFAPKSEDPVRRDGGLGLGLTLVKRLVELHGGEVGAASDGPGTGATFTVTLPLTQADASANEHRAGASIAAM